jgi:TRAP-type C4-dicarboxylate transport system substrate-binding protein
VADFVQALGAIPVVTAMGDVLPRLRNEGLSCAVTGSMTGNTLGLHKATTHIYAMPITWGLSLFGANRDSWTALEPELRVLLRNEMPKLEARIWSASEQETREGVACNTGAESCRNGKKGNMVAIPMTAQDDALRQQLLRSHILPSWLRRCGPECAAIWNRTIGAVQGITVQPSP